jgi:hypothetical protein
MFFLNSGRYPCPVTGSWHRVSGTELILYQNRGMVFDIFDVPGYDAVVLCRYTNLVDGLEGHYGFHFHSLFVTDQSLFQLIRTRRDGQL